jgi:hypothetical protein
MGFGKSVMSDEDRPTVHHPSLGFLHPELRSVQWQGVSCTEAANFSLRAPSLQS